MCIKEKPKTEARNQTRKDLEYVLKHQRGFPQYSSQLTFQLLLISILLQRDLLSIYLWW